MTLEGLVLAGAVVLGLAIGSFLNVVIYRLPRRESLSHPRSRCPSCGKQLRAIDNVPVLSWLVLRARCRMCKAPISVRYPAVEAGTAILFGLVAAALGPVWALPSFLVLAAAGVAISAIDLEHLVIPNRIVFPVLGACAVLLVGAAALDGATGPLVRAAVGSLAFPAPLLVVHLAKPAGMGLGDVKLGLLLGLHLGWLGIGHVALGFFLSFLFGSLIGLALMVAGVKGRKDAIPFGPFLVLGTVVAVVVGDPILDWYAG